MRGKLGALALALWCVAVPLGLLGCGDEGGGEQQGEEVPPCTPGGEVEGIKGRVVAPSCSEAIFFAEVKLLDQLQREIATTTADERGEFSFPASALEGDGVYVLVAIKGPFQGPDRPEPFTVSGGRSQFQLIKLVTR